MTVEQLNDAYQNVVVFGNSMISQIGNLCVNLIQQMEKITIPDDSELHKKIQLKILDDASVQTEIHTKRIFTDEHLDRTIIIVIFLDPIPVTSEVPYLQRMMKSVYDTVFTEGHYEYIVELYQREYGPASFIDKKVFAADMG